MKLLKALNNNVALVYDDKKQEAVVLWEAGLHLV